MGVTAKCLNRTVPFGDDGALLAAFQEHGLVVVAGVLSEEEVDRAVEELWTSPQLLGRSSAISRGDEASWGGAAWPQADGGRGFLESLDSFKDRSCWELAQHPRIVHVLELLYGAPVLARASRWGLMRPALRRPEWRTEEQWLHWDQNPWTQPGFARVQAFACLSAQTPTSGGLLCAPGFQRQWESWGKAHPEGSVEVGGKLVTAGHGAGNPFPVPEDDPLRKDLVRVLAPKGALVLWDGRLPHQNYPNSGSAFRLVHYLDFQLLRPEQAEEQRELLRRKLLVRRSLGEAASFFPAGLTELGRRVLCAPAEGADLEELDPLLRQAIALTAEAGADELRGDLDASVEKLRRAGKLWPEIEQWHGAIFAT